MRITVHLRDSEQYFQGHPFRYRIPEAKIFYELVYPLFHKGMMVQKNGKLIDAISIYDKVIDASQSYPDSWLQSILAYTIFKKASVYHYLGDKKDADAAYANILTRFANTQEPAILEVIAKVRANQN